MVDLEDGGVVGYGVLAKLFGEDDDADLSVVAATPRLGTTQEGGAFLAIANFPNDCEDDAAVGSGGSRRCSRLRDRGCRWRHFWPCLRLEGENGRRTGSGRGLTLAIYVERRDTFAGIDNRVLQLVVVVLVHDLRREVTKGGSDDLFILVPSVIVC